MKGLDNYITGNYGEDQFKIQRDALENLIKNIEDYSKSSNCPIKAKELFIDALDWLKEDLTNL